VFDRFSRSWALANQCWDMLMQDKRLLAFPLMSAAALVLVIGSFAIPAVPLIHGLHAHGSAHATPLSYVALLLFYWVQYSIIIFFNTALVEVVMRRFDGEEVTLGDGLKRSVAVLPTILAFAFIAATVGTLLRVVAERVGIIGKIVIGLMGFAWSISVALVVPVLAAENVGPFEAIGRSVSLIRKSWGENIIGNVGIGMVFGLFVFGTAIFGGLTVFSAFAGHHVALGTFLLIVLVLTLSLIVLAQSTLQGIYAAALYRYANGDGATGGIDTALLEGAYRART
jgi:hypothetical protein